MRSDGKGLGPLFKTDYEPVNGDYAVSFLNLVEAYSAKFFRDQGVKPKIIRKAYTVLGKEIGPYPFARLKLRTDGVSIIQKEGWAGLVDVVTQQVLFSQWETYLNKLQHSLVTNLAESWEIQTGVIVRPGVAFGKPVLKSITIPTRIVAKQYEANNKDVGLVARIFDIPQSDVKLAVQFEKKYGYAA